MRRYKVTVIVTIHKNWADIKDFEEELHAFNRANEGVLRASIPPLGIEEDEEESDPYKDLTEEDCNDACQLDCKKCPLYSTKPYWVE